MKTIYHPTAQATRYNKKATVDSYTVHHIDHFFGVRQVATILGVSQSTVRRWIKARKLDCDYRDVLVVPAGDLIDLLEGYPSTCRGIVR